MWNLTHHCMPIKFSLDENFNFCKARLLQTISQQGASSHVPGPYWGTAPQQKDSQAVPSMHLPQCRQNSFYCLMLLEKEVNKRLHWTNSNEGKWRVPPQHGIRMTGPKSFRVKKLMHWQYWSASQRKATRLICFLKFEQRAGYAWVLCVSASFSFFKGVNTRLPVQKVDPLNRCSIRIVCSSLAKSCCHEVAQVVVACPWMITLWFWRRGVWRWT